MLLRQNIPLAPYTTLQVGGAASHFVRATDSAEVAEALAFAQHEGLSLHVLGGGSNLVVADTGVSGLVLQPLLGSTEFTAEGEDVLASVGAGVVWDEFVAATVDRDLQGVECLSGIPGLVGASPIQNVGAYGQEVSESIEHVQVVDRTTGEALQLSNSACHFRYRDSFFKSEMPNRYLVMRVVFRLKPHRPSVLRYAELERQVVVQGSSPKLTSVRTAVLALRRAKSMLLDASDPDARSCGSFFLNPVVDADTLSRLQQQTSVPVPHFAQPNGGFKLPAAWLIENSGLTKGFRLGAVGLSTKHCLAIVAHQGARAAHVVTLARAIQERVEATFTVQLTPEPNFWGFGRLTNGLPEV